MKTETLQKVMNPINAYNSGELGAEEAFIKMLLPVMVEVMEEATSAAKAPRSIGGNKGRHTSAERAGEYHRHAGIGACSA